MNFRLENNFSAEKLALTIRWVLIGAAAFMALDHLTIMWIPIALGALALTNAIGMKLCKTSELYEAKGRKLMSQLRLIDGILIAATLYFPFLHSSNLWLLAIPTLIAQAMVCRTRKELLLLSGVTMAAEAAALIASNAPLQHMVFPVGSVLVGAMTGIVLASFQAREEKLTSSDHRLNSVLECGSALAANADLRATILHTLKSAILETKATCGYVMLVDEESKGILTTESAYSMQGEFDFPESIAIGSGMSGYVAKMGQAIAIASSSEGDQDYDGVTAGVKSAASVPLVTRGFAMGGQAAPEQVMGVMTLLDLKNGDSFNADDMELLRTLGSLMAVAVANARMEERRRTTFLRTLESLATALEARDEYTRGHSQRVCEVSLMIGERVGFSSEAIEELRIGTILHDIGKIGVPDEILNKRGRLTDEEFMTMKSHPVIGYEICKPLMLDEGILMIIRNHHEKLDGSGYPDGLKGGELPLSLRIVCVADAFDAMSSRRPYRGVMEMSSVMSELSKGAGTQFDPVVVEALKELLQTERMHALYRQYWEPPKEEQEQQREAA